MRVCHVSDRFLGVTDLWLVRFIIDFLISMSSSLDFSFFCSAGTWVLRHSSRLIKLLFCFLKASANDPPPSSRKKSVCFSGELLMDEA